MKRLVATLLLLIATGCSVTDVSSKMNESNDLMKENIATIQDASKTIKENTKEVNRSTVTIRGVGDKLEQLHPYFFPILIILILGILCMPVIILNNLSKKIIKYLGKK